MEKKKDNLSVSGGPSDGAQPTIASQPIEIQPGSYIESFENKRLARNYVTAKGDLKKAFEMTYGRAMTKEDFKAIDAALSKKDAQAEIMALMPSDRSVAKVIHEALNAKTPDIIKWSEKHQFVETVLKVKGQIKPPETEKQNINIAMVVER